MNLAPFDRTAIDDVVALRIQLENRLIRAAVRRMTKGRLASRKPSRGDKIAVRGINFRLHQQLSLAADLPQPLHSVQILRAKCPFDLANAIPGRTRRAVQEHRIVLQQFANDDAEGAAKAIRHHL